MEKILTLEYRTMKKCSRLSCARAGQLILLSEFYPQKTGVLGTKSECKSCSVTRSREYYKTEKGRLSSLNAGRRYARTKKGERIKRNQALRRKYGITVDKYEEMLKIQNFKCSICRTTDPGASNKFFCVDHEHSTGKVRGLLCFVCNLAVGWAENKGDLSVSSLIGYLLSWA